MYRAGAQMNELVPIINNTQLLVTKKYGHVFFCHNELTPPRRGLLKSLYLILISGHSKIKRVEITTRFKTSTLGIYGNFACNPRGQLYSLKGTTVTLEVGQMFSKFSSHKLAEYL